MEISAESNGKYIVVLTPCCVHISCCYTCGLKTHLRAAIVANARRTVKAKKITALRRTQILCMAYSGRRIEYEPVRKAKKTFAASHLTSGVL